MSFITKVAILSSLLIGTHVHAAQTCVLTVPEDCEVLNTSYSANPLDTTHVIQVTCRTRAGAIVTYLTSRQAILSTALGFGRDVLPRKITYATSGEDGISLECR